MMGNVGGFCGDDDVVGNPVIPWQELIQSDGPLILAGGGQGTW